jgi:hypothetical protein
MKRRNHPLLLLIVLFPFLLQAQHSGAALGIQAGIISKKKAKKLDLEQPYGSYVYYVYPESAAEQLGLQVFDYVLQVQDLELSDTLRLRQALNRFQPGEKVKVTYLRNGKTKRGSVKLSDGNQLDRPHLPDDQDPFLGVQSIHMKKPNGINGIAVEPVVNSTAWAMGLQEEDIITQIDGRPVIDWHDLGAAIDNRNIGDDITVEVYRKGEQLTFTRPIKSRAATHNDHSRGDGVAIIENEEEPDAPQSEAQLVPVPQEEVTALQEKSEMDMPRINNLQIDRLNVFPNPSTGIFDIQFELPAQGRTGIRIFDNSGKVIYENNLGNFSGIFSDRIDIANNAKGIYFLAVNQNDQVVTRKIILQ